MTRRSPGPAQGQGSLLDVLAEASDDPPLCPRSHTTGVKGGGWTLEVDKHSAYYGMWVHGNPNCRRPRHLAKQEGY